MCISTVGKVVAIDGDHAIVDLGGETRRAQTLLVPDVAVGDDVLIGLGTVLGRVDAADRQRLERLRSGRATATGRPKAGASAASSTTSSVAHQGERR